MTASNTRNISEYSRQELYELIWSTPASKLAADFGISDVAIAKRCKRLYVPRPGRGYWAKVEAGKTPRKSLLPPTPADEFAKAVNQSVGKTLQLPEQTTSLHPLATELLRALSKASLDSNKRAHLREPSLPEVTASKLLSEKVAKLFHVILNSLEPLGILFKKSQSSYSGGFFRKGQDRLYVVIEEDLVDSLDSRRKIPSWQSYQQKCVPSGYLRFSVNETRHSSRDAKEWTETAKNSLEVLLAQIVTGVRRHFLDAQERRAKEAIESKKRHLEWERQTREWEKKEAIRLEEERKQKHAKALESVEKTRKENLLKAADLWRLTCSVTNFINDCEQQWKRSSTDLTEAQLTWLNWAREHVRTLSPFELGYPNPVEDGPFNPSEVPFGGPYPIKRELPR